MATKLTQWTPFKGLAALRDELDRVWDHFIKDFPGKELLRGEWVPSVDVSETKDKVVVKAEVPGMEAKDLDISLTDSILTIKGKKRHEKEDQDEDYHVVESSYGSFSRSIRLPSEVQADKVKADYHNGILKVTLPKSEEAKEKKVTIQVT